MRGLQNVYAHTVAYRLSREKRACRRIVFLIPVTSSVISSRNAHRGRWSDASLLSTIDELTSLARGWRRAASSRRFPARERGDDTSVVVKPRVTSRRLHASGTRACDRQRDTRRTVTRDYVPTMCEVAHLDPILPRTLGLKRDIRGYYLNQPLRQLFGRFAKRLRKDITWPAWFIGRHKQHRSKLFVLNFSIRRFEQNQWLY